MITLNYGDFEHIEDAAYYQALKFDEDGNPEFKPVEHAWPVLFESIQGDFYGDVHVDESDQGIVCTTTIAEALTGAVVGKGFTFREAYQNVLENFQKNDQEGVNDWNDLVARLGNNVSPCYRRKEVKP